MITMVGNYALQCNVGQFFRMFILVMPYGNVHMFCLHTKIAQVHLIILIFILVHAEIESDTIHRHHMNHHISILSVIVYLIDLHTLDAEHCNVTGVMHYHA